MAHKMQTARIGRGPGNFLMAGTFCLGGNGQDGMVRNSGNSGRGLLHVFTGKVHFDLTLLSKPRVEGAPNNNVTQFEQIDKSLTQTGIPVSLGGVHRE